MAFVSEEVQSYGHESERLQDIEVHWALCRAHIHPNEVYCGARLVTASVTNCSVTSSLFFDDYILCPASIDSLL